MFSFPQDFLILSRTGSLGLCSGADEPYSSSSYGAVVELEAGKELIENTHIWAQSCRLLVWQNELAKASQNTFQVSHVCNHPLCSLSL